MKTILTLLLALSSVGMIAQNMIGNPGFEDGDDKWTTSGAEFAISEQAYSGDSVAMLSATDKSYQGIRPRTTKFELTPGTYVASFWAKAGDAMSVGKKGSIKVESNIGLGTDEAASAEVNETEWVQIYNEFTVTTLDSVKVTVRANNQDKLGMVMYVDDVMLVRKSIAYFDGGIEAGDISKNWTKLNGGVIHRTTDPDSVRSGHGACVLTVNATNDGFKNTTDLSMDGEEEGDYILSTWVKGTAGEECQLRARVDLNEDSSYELINYTIAETGVWEKIELSFTIVDTDATVTPMFRQSTFDGATTFVIDDFMLEKDDASSIEETPELALNLYPNPANSQISIDGVEAGTEYIIFSITGQQNEVGQYNGASINISSLNNGVYYIKVASNVQSFVVNK